MAELPEKFLKILRGITAKRAKTVIDHILANGHITTEELKEQDGYAHPPRGARDVREQGIPLETFKVKGADGRSIAAYRFADLSKIEGHKLGGRRIFSKQLSVDLYGRQEGRCGICYQVYERRYLQVDHRVPYQVIGDRAADESNRSAFMLICGSCNAGSHGRVSIARTGLNKKIRKLAALAIGPRQPLTPIWPCGPSDARKLFGRDMR